jgi:3-oxoacyl-[acyl-carrier protein] reductase
VRWRAIIASLVCVAIYREGRTPTDRVAIVTGGSRGIGREVARKLAGREHAVVIHYARNQAAAEAAVEEILAADGTALAVRADVADELDVARLFGETTEAFGGVDVVVHAAGQMSLGRVVDSDLDMFDAVLRTNVRGMFVVNQLASRQLRSGGAIVNLSWGSLGSASPSYAVYAACKGAVEVLTPMLARELCGRDITVNVVAAVDRRPDSLARVANVVAFLVGTEGHSVNGQVIRAGAGWFA